MNILYVYGLTDAAHAWSAVSAPPGLAAAPVLSLTLDASLVAIASYIPDTVIANDQLLDPVAAAEAALAHHAVIEWAHAQGTILPFAFGCAFRSESDLRSSLLASATQWRERLAFLAGCDEIEVRLHVDIDRLREAALASRLAAQPAGLSPGRRYLLERAVERELPALEAAAAEQAWSRWSATLDQAIHAGHLPDLRAMTVRPNQARVFLMLKSGQGISKVVEMSSEFESGIRFEFSRPWPPYSFSAAAAADQREEHETAPSSTQSFASLGGN